VCVRGLHYYCRTVRKFHEAVVARLRRLTEEYGGEIVDYLAKLTEKPLALSEISPAAGKALDSLVQANILQYACHEYLGIYSWNRSCESVEDARCGGGGFCGSLDTLAPAHRPALIALRMALQSLTGSTGSSPSTGKLVNLYKSLCTM